MKPGAVKPGRAGWRGPCADRLGARGKRQRSGGMAVTDWLYEGDETAGTIVGGGGERYPCRLEHGQVQVYLPFEVDQDRLGELLRRDGWAVGRREDRVDSQGWGPRLEVDGYYPYWLR